jgi:[acyl-carrier-protein] S-malonyltransferase
MHASHACLARCTRLCTGAVLTRVLPGSAGAFHTGYMSPAADKLAAALASTNIVAPRIPVISNVDAQPHSDPEVIKKILVQQLTSPVQWETTLKGLLDNGLSKSYEVGPGKVIAGIMKRIDKKAEITNIIA